MAQGKHAHIEEIREELIQLMRQEEDLSSEDQLYHDMLYSIEALRQEKIGLYELRLLNQAIKELRYAFKIFREYYKSQRAAVFGSARTPRDHADYKLAREFGRLLSKEGWMIITGGASGIMQAAMEGAGAKNSFGVNIVLPFEQSSNLIIRNNKKLMYFKYFFTRKLVFLKESQATVLFPGGFGTLDEGFESLTLVQTGKAKPRPILLVDPQGSSYWTQILDCLRVNLLHEGWISKHDLTLMRHYHDPRKAVQSLVDFYRNYHSSRFLKDQYLIRLRKKVTDDHLRHLNREFRGLLSKGRIRRLRDVRHDDNDDGDLERIVFYFNRSDYAQLRSLIDVLNTF